MFSASARLFTISTKAKNLSHNNTLDCTKYPGNCNLRLEEINFCKTMNFASIGTLCQNCKNYTAQYTCDLMSLFSFRPVVKFTHNLMFS